MKKRKEFEFVEVEELLKNKGSKSKRK